MVTSRFHFVKSVKFVVLLLLLLVGVETEADLVLLVPHWDLLTVDFPECLELGLLVVKVLFELLDGL